MSPRNKRFLGVSILFIVFGGFKIYSKGFFDIDGNINLFNLLVPFGMGIGLLIFTFIKINGDNKSD